MDFDALIRMAAALGAVLGLVLLAAWAMRRFGFAGIANPRAGEPRRLAVVEARTLATLAAQCAHQANATHRWQIASA